MAVRDQFTQALVDGDVDLCMRIWAVVMPKADQPKDWQEAQAMMHIARTAAVSVPFRFRAWSHHWLAERQLPSGLPDELRPKADQMRPKIVPGVGVAYSIGNEGLRPAAPLIQAAMAQAIEDNHDLITADPELLKDKIMDARRDEFKRLFGAFNVKEMER